MDEHTAFYDADLARLHDAHFGQFARAAAALMAGRLAARGLPSGTVLELGCGSGIASVLLATAGYDVAGVDLSPSMVALARERVPAGRFRVASVWDTSLWDATGWDASVSDGAARDSADTTTRGVTTTGLAGAMAVGEVVNYAADPRAGLDALERLAAHVRTALHPDGLFVFDSAGPGRGGPTGVREAEQEYDGLRLRNRAVEHHGVLRREIEITHADGGISREVHVLRLYAPDDITTALERAGFTVEVLDRYGDEPDLPAVTRFLCAPARR